MTQGISARESNLPRWAQAELRLARMRRAEAEAKVAALFPDAKSNTYWVKHLGEHHPLPANALVRFLLGEDAIDVRVNSEGRLEIRGAETICVWPMATNTVQVNLERRTR